MSAVNLAASLPRVILMGRPNVGKSTLFNRLIRSRRAITHDRPGVTRDRMEGTVRGRGKVPFILVDTGGVTMDGHESAVEGPRGLRGFEEDILRQAKEAVAEGAVICLVVDGRDGLTPFDEHLAAHLRRTGKPVLLVVNKVDSFEFPGLSGMDKMAGIMEDLRKNPPKEFGGYPVVKVTDFKKPEETGLPAANVLIYKLEGGAEVIVRPSGTEPKIKTYFTTLGKDLAEAQAQKDKLAEALKPVFA